jgi:hypothetical protein
MKSTYTTPTVVTSGDVVHNTLKGIEVSNQETQAKRLGGGANLSFGL